MSNNVKRLFFRQHFCKIGNSFLNSEKSSVFMAKGVGQGGLRYIGIGLQLSVTILCGFFAGYYFDRKLNTLPFLTLLGAALGLGVAFYNLLKNLEEKKGIDEQ
jgi:F0F1-type ATP synthase assembly protein I